MDWALRYQGMVGLAASQVWWTWEVEDAFRRMSASSSNQKQDKSAMKKFSKLQLNQLEEIIQLVRSDLSPNDRTKLTTLLTIDVHARDVVDGFVRDSIIEVCYLIRISRFFSAFVLRFTLHFRLRNLNGNHSCGFIGRKAVINCDCNNVTDFLITGMNIWVSMDA